MIRPTIVYSKDKITREESLDKTKRDFNTKVKPYFAKVTDETKRMDIAPLPKFIADLIAVPIGNATTLIKGYDVTVNGDLVTDPEYVLKSGDVVRADIGHLLNNSGFMAVVK